MSIIENTEQYIEMEGGVSVKLEIEPDIEEGTESLQFNSDQEYDDFEEESEDEGALVVDYNEEGRDGELHGAEEDYEHYMLNSDDPEDGGRVEVGRQPGLEALVESENAKTNSNSKNNLICKFCDKKFMGEVTYLVHMNNYHKEEKKYSREQSDRSFKEKLQLELHSMVRENAVLYHCDLCNLAFKTNNKLKQHKETYHEKPPENKKKQNYFFCPKCSKPCRYMFELTMHCKKMHNNMELFPCPTCTGVFSSAYRLKKHDREAHSDAEITEELLTNMLKKRKRSLKQYFCTDCSAIFTSLTKYTNHVRQFHKTKKSGLDMKSGKYECPECGRMLSSKSNLTSHYNFIHLGVRDYVCEVCNKAFSNLAILKYHMESVHLRLKPHQCDLCGKSFAKKVNVLLHIKTVHERIRDFSCEYCFQTFTQKGDMIRHKRKNHPHELKEAEETRFLPLIKYDSELDEHLIHEENDETVIEEHVEA